MAAAGLAAVLAGQDLAGVRRRPGVGPGVGPGARVRWLHGAGVGEVPAAVGGRGGLRLRDLAAQTSREEGGQGEEAVWHGARRGGARGAAQAPAAGPGRALAPGFSGVVETSADLH